MVVQVPGKGTDDRKHSWDKQCWATFLWKNNSLFPWNIRICTWSHCEKLQQSWGLLQGWSLETQWTGPGVVRGSLRMAALAAAPTHASQSACENSQLLLNSLYQPQKLQSPDSHLKAWFRSWDQPEGPVSFTKHPHLLGVRVSSPCLPRQQRPNTGQPFQPLVTKTRLSCEMPTLS